MIQCVVLIGIETLLVGAFVCLVQRTSERNRSKRKTNLLFFSLKFIRIDCQLFNAIFSFLQLFLGVNNSLNIYFYNMFNGLQNDKTNREN